MASEGEHYTQTGSGFLNRVANFFSYVPVLGAPVTLVAGGASTLLETARWLFQGKIFSAATALVAGSVSTMVNSVQGLIFAVANVGSGLTTGETLGTHARKATEIAVGGVTGLVGRKPTVLQSHYAGIGSVGRGLNAGGPGQWANYVSQRSGRDPNQQWAAYVNAQRTEAAQMQAQR
ncbi:MAG: hypothetical protein ACK5WQ_04785 [Alphaproteobacteria bacterium]|jgi:hypothetical protein